MWIACLRVYNSELSASFVSADFNDKSLLQLQVTTALSLSRFVAHSLENYRQAPWPGIRVLSGCTLWELPAKGFYVSCTDTFCNSKTVLQAEVWFWILQYSKILHWNVTSTSHFVSWNYLSPVLSKNLNFKVIVLYLFLNNLYTKKMRICGYSKVGTAQIGWLHTN